MATGNGDDINVRLGAETEGLESGLNDAAGLVNKFSEALKGAAPVIGFVGGVVAGFAQELTRMAIGVIKDAIPAFSRATEEVRKLAMVMGTTPEQASILRASLDDVGYSTGEFMGMMQRMSMRLRDGGERFEAMGVKVKDTSGKLLPMNDILMNTIETLKGYKEGTDRNLASQELLGRSFVQAADMLRLNKQLLEDNAKTAREFGVIITQEDITAFREFQLAGNDLGNVLEGFALTIGRSVMPMITDMAKWVRGELPEAYKIFKNVLNEVVTALHLLWLGFQVIWEVGRNIIGLIRDGLVGAFLALKSAIVGDFAKAKEYLGMVASDISTRWEESQQRMFDASAKTNKAIKDLWAGGGTPQEKPDDDGGKTYKKPKPALQEMNEELQQMRDLADLFRGLQIQEEIVFWEEKLKHARKGSDEYKAIQHNLYAAIRKGAAEEMEEAKAQLKQQLSDTESTAEAKYNVAVVYERLMEAAYTRDSQQFRDAEQQKMQYFRAMVEERKKMVAMEEQHKHNSRMSQLEFDREALRMESEWFFMTEANRLAAMADFDKQEYQAKRDLLLSKLDAEKEYSLEWLAIKEEMSQLEDQFNLKSIQSQNNVMLAQRDSIMGYMDMMAGTMSMVIQGMINKTMTWRDALMNIWGTLLGAFIDFLINMFVRWAATQLMMTIFKGGQEGSRAAMETAAAIKSIATAKVIAASGITAGAALAAVNAMASVAAIPVYGWAMAAPVGAATYTAAMAYLPSLAMAEKGWWEIPQDQMAMVHKKEMVIPAAESEALRGMIDGGGNVGGGGTVVNISAIDSQDVARFFRRHQNELGSAMRSIVRNPSGVVR